MSTFLSIDSWSLCNEASTDGSIMIQDKPRITYVAETAVPIIKCRNLVEQRLYEYACDQEEEDPEIQSIERQASNVIRTLDVGSLSLDSIKVVRENLSCTNQEVERMLLDCKEDIQGNKEVSDLVKEYLEVSKTLELFDALKKGLQQHRDGYLLIAGALQAGNCFRKTLEELKKVKDIQSPFGEDFMKMLRSVYEQQTQMLEKLKVRKKELDKKLQHRRKSRKIFRIIFVTTFAAATICSVLVVAMAAPPVAAAIVGALTMSMLPAGQFLNSKLNNYEKIIKGQKDVIVLMQTSTTRAVKDLEIIKTMVKNLDGSIEGMVKCAKDAVEKNAVKKGIKEIKEKIEVFKKSLEKLETQNGLCVANIENARDVVSKRIISQLNDGSSSTSDHHFPWLGIIVIIHE